MKNKRMLITLIILLAIGFATVSSTLIINGNILIGENTNDFNVIFTDAILDGKSRKRFISEDKIAIDYTMNELTLINDTSELVYEVTNTSRNYDANVSIVCTPQTEEDKVMNDYVTLDYSPKKLTVKAGEKATGSITATLTKASTEQKEFKISCKLTATPTDRTELGQEYVEPFSNAGTMIAKDYASFWKYQSSITSIVFENESKVHETTEELTFDVTAEGSASPVMAYLVPNVDDTTKYTLYINSNGGVKANLNASNYFSGFENLVGISGLEYFDTSLVTNMNEMFYYCSNITKLDLSTFDTSKVTNMNSMFYNCQKLTELDLGNFNTSNVTNMNMMFYGCRSLVELDLSSFNTSNIKNMSRMFNNCENLEKLDASGFDTSNVTDMSYMFYYCFNLIDLDLSSFDTSNVKNMEAMFYQCKNLESIDLSSFDTTNVTTMSQMFKLCYKLKNVNISSFTSNSLTNVGQMFYACYELSMVDMRNFDTGKVSRVYSMFYDTPNETIIIVKDETIQNWFLTNSEIRPLTGSKVSWTTDNVIIA